MGLGLRPGCERRISHRPLPATRLSSTLLSFGDLHSSGQASRGADPRMAGKRRRTGQVAQSRGWSIPALRGNADELERVPQSGDRPIPALRGICGHRARACMR